MKLDLRSALSFLFIVVPALIFGAFGKTAEMGLSLLVGAVAGAFLNLDKFAEFKGGGFEAKLKEAVHEAYATIDNMKEVARPLIITMISNLTFANRFDGADFNEQNKYKNEMVKLAKSLGVYDDELKHEVELFYHHNVWDLYDEVVNSSHAMKDYDHLSHKSTFIRSQLNSLYDRESKQYPTEVQIREIINTHGGDSDNIFEDAINRYVYFLKNKEPKKK
ncbi:hypothetical protein [Paenibacillus glycanilyticus]|uniref:Uncharacterized protein n=1 Tax=Paenibacillus glycanilyticus TaxID=126569 RepID=A0ABQ6GBK7_9BACL|nr:hypothetical protein [Paenibacillus glycanilyticus]GLX68324.1 hypothetical protein MU1_26690 [Paenibacillus glycanilyticus]